MRWIIKNKIIIGSFILLSVFFSGLLSLPSYATDNVEFSCPNISVYCYICGPSNYGISDLPTCSDFSDFNYLYLDFSNSPISPDNAYISNYDFGINSLFPSRFNSATFNINYDYSSFTSLYFTSTNYPFSFTYSVILSVYPLNSSCPEPEICPVLPDNPYDPKFDEIIRAIYTCGAICLVLYFFYCIYRLIIKNTGGQ